ncbi:hypothetical protein N9D66_01755 [Candidatus Nanopelagicales bacterium]|nr:hypothetical protein [Candidatus Nanopelagicales bacterium]
MSKILALWHCSRSRSTAFTRMMMERGDFTILHSPYGARYSHRNRHRRREDVDPSREVDFDKITNELRTRAQSERLFVKNPALHFIDSVDGSFLDLFQHSFLIRQPAQLVASFLAEWPDLEADEIGLAELDQMFNMVVDRIGEVPPVIDADDLVADPEGTVRAYCTAVGIAFIPEALEWEQERKKDFVYLHGTDWHKNLNKSNGLQATKNPGHPTMENSPRLRELVAIVQPHYDRLASHRIAPIAVEQ